MSNLNDSAFPIPLNPGSSYQGHGPADGFTKRERACIDLRIPESGDTELDALIEKARRQEIVAQFMAAMQGNPDYHNVQLFDVEAVASDAYMMLIKPERADD
ncbi:hypothetical protein [Vreelandella maris]|uniref:hypothetical protein n=1 Tax=Vreelandella maris TaxID=2729617 RepID=UPI0030EF7FC3|tara:strand:+ start:1346 stop:1651 length:306 start_codon:yes stop_codon:yes gene_type:complete